MGETRGSGALQSAQARVAPMPPAAHLGSCPSPPPAPNGGDIFSPAKSPFPGLGLSPVKEVISPSPCTVGKTVLAVQGPVGQGQSARPPLMTQAVHCGCDSVSPCCGTEANESSYRHDSTAKSLRAGFLQSLAQSPIRHPLSKCPHRAQPGPGKQTCTDPLLLGFSVKIQKPRVPPPSGVSEQIKGEGTFCWAKDCVASRPQNLCPPCF